jgi:Holliday junction resolvase RusA-like endonuclease
MDKKAIYQQTQKVENELTKLKNTIFALQATDLEKHGSNYEELSIEAAFKAERLTCQLRMLVYMTDFTGKSDYLKHAAEAQGIHISLNNGVLSVTLPALFPKRKIKSNTAFLHEPLNYALQEFVRKQSIPLYQYCTVCFIQIYDRRLSKKRIRDYDNLEFKQILDVISTYALIDDSGQFCDLHHMTELGEEDHTVIHIMEKSAFPKWLSDHETAVKDTSENA